MARLSRLSLFIPFLLGCGRTPTVEVVNTSGHAQSMMLFDDRDILVVDTVAQGNTRCWPVPEFAQGRTLTITATDTGKEFLASSFCQEAWIDSLRLDRSWRIQFHSPRLVDATAEWKAMDAKRQLGASVAIERANQAYVRGRTGMTAKDLIDFQTNMRSGLPREPGAAHFVPAVDVRQSGRCSLRDADAAKH